MDFAIKELTVSFKQNWENEAATTLKSSRNEYIQNLNIVDEGKGKGAVVLTGWLPNAVEDGVSEFDIKEGLLNGPNAKMSKSGSMYNTVPFKIGTPGAEPENFSTIMPKEVYDIAKKKPVGKPIVKEELPTKFQEPKKTTLRPESKFKQYEHKSSIYEGISRSQDLKTGQNTYKSFRRVSENSDDNSWIHPGIEPHHLAESTLNDFNIPQQVGIAIDKYLISIGRG